MSTNKFSTLSRTRSSIPTPELALSKESKLLTNFVQKHGLGKTVINAFNHWVDVSLPKQFSEKKLYDDTESGVYQVIENVTVSRPVIKNMNMKNIGDKPMLPSYAKNNSQPYLGEIRGSVFKVTTMPDGRIIKEMIKEKHVIGSIPIMLGSDYCWLSDLNDKEKILAGESPDDPLGYFIIDGTERVINIQEKLRTHMNHTFIDPKGRIETRTTCVRNHQSTITKLVVGKKWNSIKINLSHLSRSNNPKHYPVFLVYIMLSLPTKNFKDLIDKSGGTNNFNSEMYSRCESFIRLILSFCEAGEETRVRHALHSSCDKAMQKVDTLVSYMARKMDRYTPEHVKKNQYDQYEIIRTRIIQDMYMHVPEEYKMRQLAFGVSNTVRYMLNLRPADNRDSWSNKRLETAAKSMEKLFTTILSNIYREPKDKSSYNSILFSKITTTFRTSFQANKWGYKEDNHKENITDVLKRENPVAVFSQIGKVNSASPRQSRQTSIRMVQDQLGIICISETPEGANLGLLKNIAITTYISVERDDTHLYHYLENNCRCLHNHSSSGCMPCQWVRRCVCGQDHPEDIALTAECRFVEGCSMGRTHPRDECNKPACEYQQVHFSKSCPPDHPEDCMNCYVQDVVCSVNHIPGGTPFMVNGTVSYWLAPPKDQEYGLDILGRPITYVEQFIKKARRMGNLPYDSCISYNHTDNILEYFSNASRALRPLLIVDPDGRIRADVLEEKDPKLWERDVDYLMSIGVIELIDVREQEYIMLAMKPDQVRNRYNRKKKLERVLQKGQELSTEKLQRVEDAIRSAFDDFNEIIDQYGQRLYSYFYGLERFKKVKFDRTKFSEYLKLTVKEYYGTFAYNLIKSIYEGVNVKTKDIKNYSDAISKKIIADIIDASQVEHQVDSTALPKPKSGSISWLTDFYSIKEEVAQSVNINEIAKKVYSSFGEEHIKIMKRVPITHSEIDPVSMFGISGSLQPFPNSSQGPRSTYQASMVKQSLGSRINHHLDFSKGFKIMENPSRPTFEPIIAESLGANTSPTGTTANCAFLAVKNNNEDAIAMSRNFLETNKMDLVKYSTYKEIIPTIEVNKWSYRLIKPQPRNNEPATKYDQLDEYGIPKLDHYVRARDCIIGIQKTNSVTKEIVNVSAFVKIGEEGYIDRVLILQDAKKGLIVKVKLRRWAKQKSGDKIASRYAQKGTFSTIYDSHDMPCIIGGPNDGVIPDFLLNPHSIPSRMSVNKLKEMLACKAALWTGERVDCTAFHDYNFGKYAKILEDNGMEKNGTEKMMWPNGRIIKNITVSPCYYQCLRHHVVDHIQMRARGAVVPIVRQPVSGRANEGGLRMGEMERDGLISHGATGLVLERLMIVSDAYDIAFCKTCGNIAIPNVKNSKFECRVCDSRRGKLIAKYGSVDQLPPGITAPEPEFVTKVIPYVLKVIFHMLNGMGINTTLKFKKDSLRDIDNKDVVPISEEYTKYVGLLQ
jgi:DNA-directed RNA polymerase beta subunit